MPQVWPRRCCLPGQLDGLWGAEKSNASPDGAPPLALAGPADFLRSGKMRNYRNVPARRAEEDSLPRRRPPVPKDGPSLPPPGQPAGPPEAALPHWAKLLLAFGESGHQPRAGQGRTGPGSPQEFRASRRLAIVWTVAGRLRSARRPRGLGQKGGGGKLDAFWPGGLPGRAGPGPVFSPAAAESREEGLGVWTPWLGRAAELVPRQRERSPPSGAGRSGANPQRRSRDGLEERSVRAARAEAPRPASGSQRDWGPPSPQLSILPPPLPGSTPLAEHHCAGLRWKGRLGKEAAEEARSSPSPAKLLRARRKQRKARTLPGRSKPTSGTRGSSSPPLRRSSAAPAGWPARLARPLLSRRACLGSAEMIPQIVLLARICCCSSGGGVIFAAF